MAGFFALGTGFVNAANEKQKENRDERRETRKLAMEVFLKDTLPKVRAARAKDDEYVSKMNTVRADAYFKGNDPLAFYATKWMDQTGKDVNAFKEHVATTDMPPEIKERMQTELQKHFNYGEDGALSLKDAVPTIQPAMAPQGRKPNWYDRIMGAGNQAKDIQQGTETVARAAGVDPNASTTSRFEGINLPGSFETVDQQAKKLQDMGIETAARNTANMRNPNAFIGALLSGDREAVRVQASDPKNYVSREEEERKETTKEYRNFLLKGVASGELNHSALNAIAINDPAKLLQEVGKHLKTPEQKAAAAANIKMAEQAAGGLDNPKAFSLLYTLGVMDNLPIPKAQLDKGYAKAQEMIAADQDLQTRILLGDLNKDRKPEDQLTIDDVRAPGAASTAPNATPEPDSIDPDEGLSFDLTPRPKAEKKVEYNSLDDIVASAPPEIIRTVRDPLRLLQAAGKLSSAEAVGGKGGDTKGAEAKRKARAGEIAKNLVVSPAAAARMLDDDDYKNEWQDTIKQYVDYLPEYPSVKAAQEEVHPFGLAMIPTPLADGRIVPMPRVIPPKRK